MFHNLLTICFWVIIDYINDKHIKMVKKLLKKTMHASCK